VGGWVGGSVCVGVFLPLMCARKPRVANAKHIHVIMQYIVLDRPTEVKLGIYINSFHSISEQTMVSNHL